MATECLENTLADQAVVRCCADAKGCTLKPTAQPTALGETHPPTYSLDPTDAVHAVALAPPDARAHVLPHEPGPATLPSPTTPTGGKHFHARAHQPTPAPTHDPTCLHFKKPSPAPTNCPSRFPNLKPTKSDQPTPAPTHGSTRLPTPTPSAAPSSVPTHQPRSSTATAAGDGRLPRAAAIGAAVGPGSGAGRGAFGPRFNYLKINPAPLIFFNLEYSPSNT